MAQIIFSKENFNFPDNNDQENKTGFSGRKRKFTLGDLGIESLRSHNYESK